MLVKILIGVVLAAGILIGLATKFGSMRWVAYTRELRAKLEENREAIEPKVYDEAEIEGLPASVQRYFRKALKPGQPMIAAVYVEHVGTFNLSSEGEQWTEFSSTQRVTTRRAGFDWEASMSMGPGLVVRVHDAYIAGEGILNARIFGLIPIVDIQGTPEAAEGELMRYFAEMAWYPTALLPSQGVSWEALDDSSAKATLKEGDMLLTMTFRFREDGLIEAVGVEKRGRTVGKAVVPTPWEGHWSEYEERDGMLVPLVGEVAWLLPEGAKPYWRGRIVKIIYEYAE